jgi:hypothetical protein
MEEDEIIRTILPSFNLQELEETKKKVLKQSKKPKLPKPVFTSSFTLEEVVQEIHFPMFREKKIPKELVMENFLKFLQNHKEGELALEDQHALKFLWKKTSFCERILLQKLAIAVELRYTRKLLNHKTKTNILTAFRNFLKDRYKLPKDFFRHLQGRK